MSFIRSILTIAISTLVLSFTYSPCVFGFEFINNENFPVNIAVATWHGGKSYQGSRENGSSSMPSIVPSVEKVTGWFTIKPGGSITVDKGDADFHFAWSTWENMKVDEKKPYFWVHRNQRFRTIRERKKNQIDIGISFEGTIFPSTLASIPGTVSFGNQTNGANSFQNNKSNPDEQFLKNNNWAPFQFFTVPSGARRGVFANGKCSWQ